MSTKALGGVVALIVGSIVLGITLLGGNQGGGDADSGNETDGAFLAEMVPHHESAIEMAKIALDRAEHPETEELARSIIATQGEEIGQLEDIHQRLFGEPIEDADHGSAGMDGEMMETEGSMQSLEAAEPFDREFIDMMIPHHQSAIEMARMEIEEGSDPEARALAQAIIEAQSAEIEDMNEWRTEWYGKPSPAGGVPEEGETTAPSHEEMGH